MIVYIDGENLRHRLKDVLVEERLITDNDDSFRFDLVGLLNAKLGDNVEKVIYYTTKMRKLDRTLPIKMIDKLERIKIASRTWLSQLSNQKVAVVKAGYLNVRETGKCPYCKKTVLTPQEKGVDVRIATDILLAAVRDKQKQIALICSDSDLLPALNAIKNTRTKVIYIGVSGSLNPALQLACDTSIKISKDDIIQAFTGVMA